jgi:hypothetical protein
MTAAIWTVISLFGALTIGSLFWLGTKIDQQGQSLGSRIDALGARLDERIEGLAARTDQGGSRRSMPAWMA